MFSALNEQGLTCILYRLSRSEVEQLKKSGNFYCPSCKEAVRIRTSLKYAPHFAHWPRSSCTYKGETLQHQKGKLLIYEWLARQGLSPELEHYLPEIQQRPDVYVEWKKYVFAIEFQCSVIPPSEVRRRSRQYRKAGIIPLWFLTEDKVKGKYPQISFSSFLRSFLYRFGSHLHFYTFSPQSKVLSLFTIRQSLSSRKLLVKKSSRSLFHVKFPDIFKTHGSTISLDWWLRSVYFFRTTPYPGTTGRERQFRQFLYLNHISPSLLPSLCFLPLPSQPLYDVPTVIWQSRIIITYVSGEKVGRKLSCPPIHVTDVLGDKKIDLMEEYLRDLAYLGFVEKKEGCWYKSKAIPFPKNIEQALRQDKELMIQLKRRDEMS